MSTTFGSTLENTIDLIEPFDACFLCNPEPWRVIFTGRFNQIVAGAGPLCPGYVLLSPIEHFGTAAELPSPVFEEFLALAELLRIALSKIYGEGYTAYEHGRIGACRIREAQEDWSTYCHHAHRVFIPMPTSLQPRLVRHFSSAESVETPAQLRTHSGKHYIYYETSCSTDDVATGYVLSGREDLPSQFMRRALTEVLGKGRSWNWAADHRLPEMLETTNQLRPFFCGLDNAEKSKVADALTESSCLKCDISIDGFSCVGKTSIAECLADYFNRPFLDTGLVFRFLAEASLRGIQQPSPCEMIGRLLAPGSTDYLRTAAISAEAGRLARNPDIRILHEQIIRAILKTLSPCVLVGRDAWRYLGADGIAVVLEATEEIRVYRRYLELARSSSYGQSISSVLKELRAHDDNDLPKLPPHDLLRLVRVQNDRQPLADTLHNLLNKISVFL